jgi:uncharacterized protein YjiK
MNALSVRTAVGALALAAGVANAQFSLSNYTLQARYALPAVEALEASAITYNPVTDTLFVLGDEGDGVVEVSKTGALLNFMALTGFEDTEALTHVGGGRFVIGEERLQNAYQFTFTPGGTIDRSAMPVSDLGPTVGNIGVEGLSYDPRTGTFYGVKEKTPQRVFSAAMDFSTASSVATVNDLFAPALPVTDLSDIQVLATVPGVAGSSINNFLIFSQESNLLMEVTPTGTVVSTFSTAFLGRDNIEGVTIDANGFIYLVGEEPEMFVLVPAPGVVGVLGAGLLALSRRRR